jgi:hypothetical protein
MKRGYLAILSVVVVIGVVASIALSLAPPSGKASGTVNRSPTDQYTLEIPTNHSTNLSHGPSDLNLSAGYITQFFSIPNGSPIPMVSDVCLTNDSYDNTSGGLLILPEGQSLTCQRGDFAWEFAFDTNSSFIPEILTFQISTAWSDGSDGSVHQANLSGQLSFLLNCKINCSSAPVWVFVDYGSSAVDVTSLLASVSWVDTTLPENYSPPCDEVLNPTDQANPISGTPPPHQSQLQTWPPDISPVNGYWVMPTCIPSGPPVPQVPDVCIDSTQFNDSAGALLILPANSSRPCAIDDFGWELAFNTSSTQAPEIVTFTVTTSWNNSGTAVDNESVVGSIVFPYSESGSSLAPFWVIVDYGPAVLTVAWLTLSVSWVST